MIKEVSELNFSRSDAKSNHIYDIEVISKVAKRFGAF
ncbi:MAG: hypothetical protein KatS3mg003_1150 [Candidatus Nitrosocaldaceae archaeon]|nr:MAG: hypothetical protein KatS3mg003_1150 [Candidatus Nitrosocaldaceae archaeon]